jgi:hypothetical protein
MNATVFRAHSQGSRALLAQLVDAIDALPPQMAATDQLAHDRDIAALDRLERIAERCNGLARLAMQARAALQRELDQLSPEAA